MPAALVKMRRHEVSHLHRFGRLPGFELMTLLVGVDFTSRPTRRKPITVACGRLEGGALRLEHVLRLHTHEAFADWLRTPGPWIGAFDFPFGLPRELVHCLGWPEPWLALMQHYTGLSREQIRDAFAAFCAARAAGSKFAHRATDRPAGSSPSMKWVNPPVAYMMHAGVPALLSAGVHLPGLHEGDASRVALEGYPGLLARELLAARSYKSDELAKQTPVRHEARCDLVAALVHGRCSLGLQLQIEADMQEELVADASGDLLDAVLCMMQAGWAEGQEHYGLPPDIDPLEGWIVTAPWN
jgi:hypothetical protein